MIAPEILLVVELFTVRAPFSLIASDVKAPVVTVRLLSGFVPPTAAFKLTCPEEPVLVLIVSPLAVPSLLIVLEKFTLWFVFVVRVRSPPVITTGPLYFCHA